MDAARGRLRRTAAAPDVGSALDRERVRRHRACRFLAAPPKDIAVALFGDIDLDFRQATIPSGGVALNVVAPFGNVDVVVPAGTRVDVGGLALFGSKKVSVERARLGRVGADVLVRGFTLFGSLKVWSRRARPSQAPSGAPDDPTAADVAPPPIGRGADASTGCGWDRTPPASAPLRPSAAVVAPVQATGVVWLTVTVTLVASVASVFTGDLRSVAVQVTVVEDTVVRWLADLDLPGLSPATSALAVLSSWAAITVLVWGQLLALLILKRVRHLLVVVVAWTVQGVLIQYLLGSVGPRRPRPFGVESRTDWFAWALPSEQMAALTVGSDGDPLRAGAGRTLASHRQVGGGRGARR